MRMQCLLQARTRRLCFVSVTSHPPSHEAWRSHEYCQAFAAVSREGSMRSDAA